MALKPWPWTSKEAPLNKWSLLCVSILAIVTGWWFWPRPIQMAPVDESVIADAVMKVTDVELSNPLNLSEDVVLSFSFLPKIEWPDDQSLIVVLSVIPDGKSYEAAKISGMMRRTAKTSVSLGVMRNGKVQQVSPPPPAPNDPRCHYYAALSRREIPFDGPCRLEVMLMRVPKTKTGNYGQHSPMPATCLFRRNVEITQ